MTKEKITDCNVAAKKIKELLDEKSRIENQLDQLTKSKAVISQQRKLEACICLRDTYHGHGADFSLDKDLVMQNLESMLEMHSNRLAEINESLLLMVRLAD